MPHQQLAHERVREIAVESYGRLLAFIASRFGDVIVAEDALSKAFLGALAGWPKRGIPDRPEAWLLAAASNAVRDDARQKCVRERHLDAVKTMLSEMRENPLSPFPDERLKLMFICAHPAIDPFVRTPLMLQVVLKLDAARIAEAYQVPAATMGQRLSRAKAKIKAARLRFEIPERHQLPERLQAVLESIYAAYGIGWEDLGARHHSLAKEALWLARVLASLMPGDPEVRGLYALLLHTEARREARRYLDGRFVPLLEQDVSLWNRTMQVKAEQELWTAYHLQQQTGSSAIGPFQIEAAIQSAHASRSQSGSVPWRQIADLYNALVSLRPSLGAVVGRAAAHASAFGSERGLEALELSIAFKSRFDYQPYWAARAELLRQSGNEAGARESYEKAIALASDPATKRYLQQQLADTAK